MYHRRDRAQQHLNPIYGTQSHPGQEALFGLTGNGMAPPSNNYIPRPVEVGTPYSRTSGLYSAWGPPAEPELDPNGSRKYKPSQVSFVELGRINSQMPLANWVTTNDGPYIPKGAIPDPGSCGPSHERGRATSFHARDTSSRVGHYRQEIRAEELHVSYGAPTSDSGYETRPSLPTASLRSVDINMDSGLDSPNILKSVQKSRSYNGDMYHQDIHDGCSGPRALPKQTSSSQLICKYCRQAVKTASELKKHTRRHEKPFVCREKGCGRTEGFSTSNDLDRHMKSKHAELGCGKTWQCLVDRCKSNEKRWPRLDNFRSHLKRVHHFHGEKLDDFVRWTKTNQREVTAISGGASKPDGNLHRESTTLEGPYSPHKFAQDPGNDWTSNSPMALDNSDFSMESTERVHPSGTVGLYSDLNNHPMEPLDTDDPSSGGHHGPEMRSSLPRETEAESTPATGPHHSTSDGDDGGDDDELTLHEMIPNTQVQQTDTFEDKVFDIDSMVRDAMITALAKTKLGPTGISDDDKHAVLNPNGKPMDLPQDGNGRASVNKSNNGGPPRPGHPDRRCNPAGDADTNCLLQKDLNIILEALTVIGYSIKKNNKDTKDTIPQRRGPNKVHKLGANCNKKSENLVTCEACMKFTGRPCDLRKHMKRHERPYGCTRNGCNKSFGRKNDWKRHENSQHFQHDRWQCNEPKADGTLCAKVIYHPENFKNHLLKSHKIQEITDEYLHAKRRNESFMSEFWCGFCREMVDADPTHAGVDTWGARFNHIDDHFMGRENNVKASILHWIHQPELDMPKSTSEPPSSSTSPSSNSGDGESDVEEVETNKSSPAALDSLSPSSSTLGKRGRESDDTNEKPPKFSCVTVIICCECRREIGQSKICANCPHNFCARCPVERHTLPTTNVLV